MYKAHHRVTGAVVAIKAISLRKMDRKAQENLESEIHILQEVRHPNIVRLFEIQKSDRYIYLVLEYCAGGDLSRLIHKKGPFSEAKTQYFMRQLASGLRFLWNRNLIHRDLKPQNLLLTSNDEDAVLKIADFGFARHLAAASLAETLCGSPLYMAPEILRYQRYDAKADLWSVGTILYEMLSKRPPFGGRNHVELLANIERQELRLPEGVEISSECLGLLRILLRRNPVQRASFEEFFSSKFVSDPLDASHGGKAAPGRGGAGGAAGASDAVEPSVAEPKVAEPATAETKPRQASDRPPLPAVSTKLVEAKEGVTGAVASKLSPVKPAHAEASGSVEVGGDAATARGSSEGSSADEPARDSARGAKETADERDSRGKSGIGPGRRDEVERAASPPPAARKPETLRVKQFQTPPRGAAHTATTESPTVRPPTNLDLFGVNPAPPVAGTPTPQETRTLIAARKERRRTVSLDLQRSAADRAVERGGVGASPTGEGDEEEGTDGGDSAKRGTLALPPPPAGPLLGMRRSASDNSLSSARSVSPMVARTGVWQSPKSRPKSGPRSAPKDSASVAGRPTSAGHAVKRGRSASSASLRKLLSGYPSPERSPGRPDAEGGETMVGFSPRFEGDGSFAEPRSASTNDAVPPSRGTPAGAARIVGVDAANVATPPLTDSDDGFVLIPVPERRRPASPRTSDGETDEDGESETPSPLSTEALSLALYEQARARAVAYALGEEARAVAELARCIAGLSVGTDPDVEGEQDGGIGIGLRDVLGFDVGIGMDELVGDDAAQQAVVDRRQTEALALYVKALQIQRRAIIVTDAASQAQYGKYGVSGEAVAPDDEPRQLRSARAAVAEVAAWLRNCFTRAMAQADACATRVPTAAPGVCVEELLYEHALRLGRTAGVREIFSHAHAGEAPATIGHANEAAMFGSPPHVGLYTQAVLLLKALSREKSLSEEDGEVIRGFLRSFAARRRAAQRSLGGVHASSDSSPARDKRAQAEVAGGAGSIPPSGSAALAAASARATAMAAMR